MQLRTRENPFENNTEIIKGKVIRKPEIAKKILKLGGDDVRIIDIKPSKNDKAATCFVFKDDEKFQKIFESVLEENRKARIAEHEKADELEELRQEIARLKRVVEDKG